MVRFDIEFQYAKPIAHKVLIKSENEMTDFCNSDQQPMGAQYLSTASANGHIVLQYRLDRGE